MTDATAPLLPLVDLQSMSIFTPRRVSLVTDLTWVVRPGEHWALLGPNGAGKSTTLAVVGATRHPSAGVAEVLGRRLGRTDLRELRTHIGVVDHALRIPPDLSAVEVVLTGLSGTVQTLVEGYPADDHARGVLPTSLLIDRTGKIVWRQIGAIMPNDAKLKAAVEKAVAER